MDLTFAAATTIIGALCLKSGRGPCHLIASGALHVSAALRLLTVMAEAAWGVRGRYRECLESIKREI